MKIFLKCSALLLCVLMLLASASCIKDRDPDLPEGMKLATAPGAEFRLYIPTSWNVNQSYGVSGGYYNLNVQSSVSMSRYDLPPSESFEAGYDGASLWEYYCRESLASVALSGSVEQVGEPSSDIVAKCNAFRMVHTAIVSGDKLYFMYIFVPTKDAMYLFSYIADEDLYESLLPDVEKILDHFAFADVYLPDDYLKDTDADVVAPDGMKLASNNDVAYRFFVPEAWKIDLDERIFAAHFEADGASVSVVPYSPDVDSMSVSEYFALCEERMKAMSGADAYALLSSEKVELGGRQATAYTYTYKVGGRVYQYKQVIAAYRSMLYSMTYTATPETFDAHLDDVARMIDAFEFR